MNTTQRIAACALALAVVPATWAAGNKASAEAQAKYNKERAHCMSGQSNQDRATCLKEAGAALAEAKRNNLGTSGDASLAGNALARCGAQPDADKQACVQRIQGAGSAQGSVEAGGLIRSTETPVK
ncbi:MAG: hypothetical protein HYX47_23220 [Burkholderiales bacterium]|nr:hypothetical protein [Burkholderiales bacterium]